MISSISAGKSGSNWLDRLRSSKGFPADHHLDLEQFLNHRTPDLTSSTCADSVANRIDSKTSSNSAPCDKNSVPDGSPMRKLPSKNGPRDWVNVVSNVLSELFIMGDATKLNGKKSCRKQRNPKLCVLSPSQGELGLLASSLPRYDKVRETNEVSNRLKVTACEDFNIGSVDGEEEEDKEPTDLLGFSKTEVTVIDTSFPSWKFEKTLFRRKNVWKVRDRKSKAGIVNRKKRKSASSLDNAMEDKKPCSSSNNEIAQAVNDGSKRIDETRNETTDHGQDQEKRFPKKLNKGDSSVLLMRLPISKKTGQSKAM